MKDATGETRAALRIDHPDPTVRPYNDVAIDFSCGDFALDGYLDEDGSVEWTTGWEQTRAGIQQCKIGRVLEACGPAIDALLAFHFAGIAPLEDDGAYALQQFP